MTENDGPVMDIVVKLRDAIALEGISVPELRSLLEEAAETIERQATYLAIWKAGDAIARGSVEQSAPDAGSATVITEAPVSTPR